jgi:hypothetical protein
LPGRGCFASVGSAAAFGVAASGLLIASSCLRAIAFIWSMNGVVYMPDEMWSRCAAGIALSCEPIAEPNSSSKR